MRESRRAESGRALVALLVSLAVAALAALPVGGLGGAAARRSALEAARGLAAVMREQALLARTRGRSCGMRFDLGPLAAGYELVDDGDGDGLSSADLRRGVDRVRGRHSVASDHPAMRFARPARRLPAVPPSRGTLDPDEPAVRFSRSGLLAFSPEGHATPGSVFIGDGRESVCAVVVSGAGGRVRCWCLDASGERWVLR